MILESSGTKLFGGIAVPGAEYVALEWIVAAFNFGNEAEQDRSWNAVEFTSSQREDEEHRVWWTYRDGNGRSVWVSLNPGEFKVTPPEQPCIIREIPDGTPKVRCRDIFNAAVETCRRVPSMSARERELLQAAERWTGGTPFADLSPRFQALIRAQPGEATDIINQLYADGLFGFQCARDYFSFAMVLVQLQRILNLRIEQDWLKDPGSYLYGFAKLLLSDPERKPNFIRAAREVFENEYEPAREAVTTAMRASSLVEMLHHLVLADHRFLMVRAVEHCLRENGVDAEEIPFSSIVAEEAQVCVISGLGRGAKFCVQHPESEARDLIERNGPSLARLQRDARSHASHIWPTFTRLFADILAAQALTLRPGHVPEGVAELQRLEDELVLSAALERAWINNALLKAYKSIGDEQKARAIAARVIGTALVRRTLGSSAL